MSLKCLEFPMRPLDIMAAFESTSGETDVFCKPIVRSGTLLAVGRCKIILSSGCGYALVRVVDYVTFYPGQACWPAASVGQTTESIQIDSYGLAS